MIDSPIFIIGAGRSGTNILRDSIVAFDDVITWPCDEINLIFRHGNRNMPDDEFDEGNATHKVQRFIKKQFEKLEAEQGPGTIVEKTCANSLRIPFLQTIFPKARFVLIARNGFDVTASAMKRWTASIELRYLLKKVRYVPVADVPYYFWLFARNRWKQLISGEKRLKSWGPIYKGMKAEIDTMSLDEVCAKQWARCLQKAYDDLHKVPAENKYFLTYEALTTQPDVEIEALLKWLKISYEPSQLPQVTARIRSSGTGKGRVHIKSEAAIATIDEVTKTAYDKIRKVTETPV